MDFRVRQLKRALEPLIQALESHHRCLEELESALNEFEETLSGREERPERPQAKHDGEGGRGGLDILSITDVCQELGMGKSWVYRRIQSGGDTFSKARAQHKGPARRSRRVPRGPALPANVRISHLSSSRTL